MARYLVTGGAGFIGSNIAERLVETGEEVVVFDNLSTGHEGNIEHFRRNIRFVKGDIRNESEVRAALEGVDYVLHQAALASVPRSIDDPVLVNEVNVGGTLTVLEESRRASVKCFVYAASSSAYGDSEVLPKREDMLPAPLSPYAVSKLVGEHYCSVYSRVYGLPTVSIRYFNVFGPRQDPASQYAAVIPIFVSHLLEGKSPTIYGDGEQSRDFTFVGNIVKANLMAAQWEGAAGQVINVACGGRYTLNELYRMLCDLTGVSIDPVYADPRPGDVKHSHADITLSEKLLGYSVETGFEEGLKRTVEWYKQSGSP
ncbi:MAG TPA: SDR family oxidoreductase [Candidatus Eisenbacteria bacterium]|uniref:SDR family oxidoreductase n=1 Tax=Eiseniibacteriota bacterium TaxID=2212470 RepID=A0A7V2AW19_UNCEI|nr:SDR family oxidoreductase [Candidatus Eisenbacteria bacterium]